MYTKKNLILFTALLLGASWGYAAEAQGVLSAVQTRVLLQAQIAQQRQMLSSKLPLDTAHMQWKRCNVFEYRQRANNAWSKSGVKQVITDCQDVIQRCNAISREGHVFVSTACFYPQKTAKQQIYLTQIHLISQDGSRQELDVLGSLEDWMVLAVK